LLDQFCAAHPRRLSFILTFSTVDSAGHIVKLQVFFPSLGVLTQYFSPHLSLHHPSTHAEFCVALLIPAPRITGGPTPLVGCFCVCSHTVFSFCPLSSGTVLLCVFLFLPHRYRTHRFCVVFSCCTVCVVFHFLLPPVLITPVLLKPRSFLFVLFVIVLGVLFSQTETPLSLFAFFPTESQKRALNPISSFFLFLPILTTTESLPFLCRLLSLLAESLPIPPRYLLLRDSLYVVLFLPFALSHLRALSFFYLLFREVVSVPFDIELDA